MMEFFQAEEGYGDSKRKKETEETNFCLPGDYYAAHLLKLFHILWPR